MMLILKERNIELIPYDEKNIGYLYDNIVCNRIEGFEECKIKQKKDLYEFMNNKKIHIKLFVKNTENNKIIGYIAGYNYNKIDGYIYVSTVLEDNNDFNKKAINLFITYLFNCFPIRKIYCEILDCHEKKMKLFNTLGFKEEADLEKDTFFDGEYFNKNILSLYREDYKNE